MFVFPAYSLIQVLLFPIFGVTRYIKTVIKTRNIGFMKIHYKKNYPPLEYITNILIILILTLLIFNIHFVEKTLLLSNIDLFSVIGVDFKGEGILLIIYNGLKLSTILTGVFLFLMVFFKLKYHIKLNMKDNLKNTI